MAGFQGGLTGPFVRWFGEKRTVAIGLATSMVAATGYGLAPSLSVVVVLMLVHGPEGFIHPMLTALMSKRVPENAQGELQGGLSAIMNLAMLTGTIFYTQLFGYFMGATSPFPSADIAYFVAGGGMAVTLALYLWLVGHQREAGAAKEETA